MDKYENKRNITTTSITNFAKDCTKSWLFTRISDIPPIIIKHIAQSAQLPIPIETEWEAYSKTRTIKGIIIL